MKKKLVPTLCLFLFWSCSTINPPNNASIGFTKEKHDFGKVSYKKEVSFLFEFCNLGKTMLIIHDVKTSCGCTVPDWPKKPIKPREKGIIKISYDAAHVGIFHKTIKVFYNGPNSPAKLEIKGEVEYDSDVVK